MSSIFGEAGGLREAYRARHEPENAHALLVGFWRTLLLALAFGSVLVIAFGAFQLFDVLGALGEANVDSAPALKLPLARAQLDAVLDGFKTRDARREMLRHGLPVVDPSR